MQQWTPSDLQSWKMTEQSLKDGDDNNAKFLVFLNFWLNTAEAIMAEPVTTMAISDPTREGEFVHAPTALPPTPANAIRKALEVAEQRLGFIDVWFLGQLLAVIGTYWQHGDALCREMSIIELKLTGEALRIKLDDLAVQAVEETGDGTIRVGSEGGSQDLVDTAQAGIDPLDELLRRPGDRSDVTADPARGMDQSQPPERADSGAPIDDGTSPVRNRLSERPRRKGGKPLDRRPSRGSEGER